MQVKVFEAQDMRSALEKVKGELGPEALILSTRSIQKKKLGFPGKPWIEVTAAVDGSQDPEESSPDSGYGPNFGPEPGVQVQPRKTDRTYSRNGNFEDLLANSGHDPLNAGRPVEDRGLFQELREMKQSFQGLVREFSEVRGKWAKERSSLGPGPQCQDFGLGDFGQKIWTGLSALGLGAEFLELFAERQKASLEFAVQKTPDGLEEHLEQSIAGMIRLENPVSIPLDGQKRLSFIGPTGVGK
ncbi:MAG: hypothetical protein ACOC9D_02540, partial [Thermodesulfobacteriota bacterium]